eukprot:COSAG02_NODE_11663_length_1677_cov_2.332700_2_plen_87_part_01
MQVLDPSGSLRTLAGLKGRPSLGAGREGEISAPTGTFALRALHTQQTPQSALGLLRGWRGGRHTSQMPQMTGTKHVRLRSHPHGPSP